MNQHFTLLEVEAQFKNFLITKGHPIPGAIRFDQMKHVRYRCPFSKNKGNRDVSYKAHSDGKPTIKFECHACGLKENFTVNKRIEFTEAEKKKWQTQIQQQKQEAISNRQMAIQKVKYLWSKAKPCTSHPYFAEKKTFISKTDGLRVDNRGTLLLPVYSNTGELISCQRVFFDEVNKKFVKFFVKDAPAKGGYHILGAIDDHETVFLAEGIATCLSIRESVQTPVICVYGKKFHEVAPIIAKAYPGKQIIFCADHPSEIEITKQTRSEDSAKKAIALIGGSYVLPNFEALGINENERKKRKLTDFNDLFVELLNKGLNRKAALAQVQLQLTNFIQGCGYGSKCKR